VYPKSLTTSMALAALSTVFWAVAVAAAQPGDDARGGLTREMKYWRGAREESPGSFLSRKPVATGVLVTCDRWPDASDLRSFAIDAIRLSGAKTEQEKALAVWRWIRRFKVHTDGNFPCEPLAQKQTSYVTDPIKVLNVYGAHFCGGLSRVIELVWRGYGMRADRVHCWSHSMADLYYKDFDGVTRPHLFDTNFGGYMYHSSRKRLMGPDDYATDYWGGKTSWIHNYHWPWPTHRLELSFRQGEKLDRIWGNLGKPYQAHMDPKRDSRRTPLFERGPYTQRTYGNGLWTYSPNPADPTWLEGLAEPPAGLAAGALVPAAAGRPATVVWHFRTPYIVSDMEVNMKVVRKNKTDRIRLHVSVDDGQTWKQLWEMQQLAAKPTAISAAICPKFKVLSKGQHPPKDSVSPFGRYAFRVKLELMAGEAPGNCRVEAITFRTTVQQNIYALPQLQPGRNRITVRGKLEPASSLKITYLWDDPKGQNRRNVTVLEKLPAEYEIVVAGRKWEDCVCKSISVETLPATGKGNRTEVKEAASPINKLPAIRPVRNTRGRRGWWLRANPKKCPPTASIVSRIKGELKKIDQLELSRKQEGADSGKIRQEHQKACGAISGQLKYLLETRDPRAFDVVKEVVYKTRVGHTKSCGLVVLTLCGGDKARPIMVDLLENPQKFLWTDAPVKKGPKTADQQWASVAVTVAVLAADRGWPEVIPGLVKVLESKHCFKHIPHAIIRTFVTNGDKRALPGIKIGLKTRGQAAFYAALAAAHIGDRSSIADIRKLLMLGGKSAVGQEYAALALGRLKDTASIPKLQSMLKEKANENLRYAAAEALGDMGQRSQIPTLKAALVVEPFPWIQEKIKTAIKKLEGSLINTKENSK
jgi:HEAT repeats